MDNRQRHEGIHYSENPPVVDMSFFIVQYRFFLKNIGDVACSCSVKF
jgi:hypothetical protein